MAGITKQTVVDYTSVDAQSATATQKALRAVHESNTAYNAEVVKTLEAYLAEQLADGSLDIGANMALLKLYLVYPETADVEKIANVLVKAVAALPSPFFTGASAIVPESFREDANVKQALNAGFILKSGKFEEFWQLDLAFASKAVGFTDAVRAFMVDALRKSHSIISVAVLKAKLGVADVAEIAAAEHWVIKNDLVTITPNEDNQMRPAKVQENIAFDDVLKVIHTLSR